MKNLILIINILFASVLLSGCAMFGSGSDLQQKGFYGRIAPANNSMPLPVEIAKDIASISEEGVLYIKESSVVSKIEDAVIDKSQSKRRVSSVVEKKPEFLSANRKGPLLAGNRAGGLRGKRSNRRKGPLSIGRSNLPKLTGGKTVSYVVKWGDTLMKIAFEKYANYLRWKDIYHVNKDKMESPRKMRVGTELTIENVKYVYIKKDGRPYLIKKEDTLKSISQKLYGTPDRWKEIWKNNPELIQSPKKIYAGFTLYYKDKNTSKDTLRVPAGDKKASK